MQPELNIAKIAGAPLTTGVIRKHNANTIKKLSEANKGKKPTIAIAASNKSCSIPVQILNIKTNELKIFSSVRKAATYINSNQTAIHKYLKKKNIY